MLQDERIPNAAKSEPEQRATCLCSGKSNLNGCSEPFRQMTDTQTLRHTKIEEIGLQFLQCFGKSVLSLE